jgi:hypothetical protein
VLGQEPAHDSKGQWLAMPSARRSQAAATTRNSSWAPVSIERGESDLVDQDQVVAEQGVDHVADGVAGQAPVEALGQAAV